MVENAKVINIELNVITIDLLIYQDISPTSSITNRIPNAEASNNPGYSRTSPILRPLVTTFSAS